MAVDMFLKLDSIPGESTDSDHKGEIDIFAFTFGVAQTGVSGTSGSIGAGKAHFQDIAITKNADMASPTLMRNCAVGQPIKTGQITVRRAGGGDKGGKEYYIVKLENILVSSFSNSGDTGGDRPIEAITLNFSKVTFDYYPQKPDGTLGGVNSKGYDLSIQKAF